ncbi:MAG: hypothetical protein Q9224_006378, partial [Gallowayella concinna]
MSDLSRWKVDIEGNFPLHKAVVEGMYAQYQTLSIGLKLTPILKSNASRHKDSFRRIFRYINLDQDGENFRHSAGWKSEKIFLKGQGARAVVEGEFHSASAIDAVVPGLVPKAAGWGSYDDGEKQVYFFLGDFHDMDFSAAPDPESFIPRIAHLHRNGKSPNDMFGFPVPTACGKMERTVIWEQSWAKSFTHQLKDVIRYDNATNGPWLEYDAACQQLIDGVIPRFLGVVQSEG